MIYTVHFSFSPLLILSCIPAIFCAPIHDSFVELQHSTEQLDLGSTDTPGSIVWQGLMSGLIGLALLVMFCFFVMFLSLIFHFYQKSHRTEPEYAPLPSSPVVITLPLIEESSRHHSAGNLEEIPDYQVNSNNRLTEQAVYWVSQWLYTNHQSNVDVGGLVLIRESDGSLHVPHDSDLLNLTAPLDEELPAYQPWKEILGDEQLPEYE
ncbi:hypothetical protein K493DRAFT_14644 [Basidiobolus meristosporus CBS 931.73]|uniref:Uncharacterized protein n=1 Tax=Basidiobolus meristosporus CBS 931.73 TaxID=1314790 RepID=A0A1Y1YH88_9FUNG|nr:hypothetical protein K493DRAFT_14644 [Basidiobolus meristosporus CBS 931.73]|eukprot:ORX97382.1 hypothetical protein K493DRAFT_14644 [Basidiobolus meristosporus CBS 931.73]